MIYPLIIMILFLLFARSVDNINVTGLSNEHMMPNYMRVDPDIHSVIEDFNYFDVPIDIIAKKKLPFINHNRKIFCNSDLLDIHQSKDFNLNPMSYLLASRFSKKILYFEHYVFSGLFKNNREVHKYYKNLFNDSHSKKMHDALCKFNKILERLNYSLVPKEDVLMFLKAIEAYLCHSPLQRIEELLLNLKLSTVFNRIFKKEYLTLNEIKTFMYEFVGMYKRILNNLKEIIIYFMNNKSLNHGSECHTSSIVKKYLYFKWTVVCEINQIVTLLKDSKQPTHMMIYSTNADEALIDVMSNVVKEIIDKNSKNILDEINKSKFQILSTKTARYLI